MASPITAKIFKAATDAHRRGEMAAAVKHYNDVVKADPNHAPAHFLLGLIDRAAGRIPDALTHVRQAVRIAPDNTSYRQGLAEVLLADGRTDAAERAFRETILCDPAVAAAWAWLGGRLEQSGDLPAAERIARRRRYLSGDPSAILAHAEILSRLGDVAAAWPLARSAVNVGGRYDPLSDLKSGLMFPPVPINRDQIESARRRFSESLDRVADSGLKLEDPVSQIGRAPFYLAYHGLDDRPLAERFDDVLNALTPAFRERRPAATKSDRTRVGVFSTFFNAHTVLRYSQGLIKAMARRADIELLVLPTATIPDAASAHLASLGAGVAAISNDYPQATREIRALNLDVLIFADIGMEPLSGALARSDLATRTIALSGHPVTTGIRRLSGYVTCPGFEPQGFEAHYTEPLIRAAFWPLDYIRPTSEPAALPSPDRDPNRPTLLCAQSLFKIHPDMDAMFHEILERVPSAVLYFIDLPHGMRPVTERFRSRLVGAGIDVERRIRFLPRMPLAHFLGWLRHADVVLDSRHFSGGDSSLSTLAAGAPVVTSKDAFYRGRQTAGLLRAMGVTETIAATSEGYIQIAERMATDPGYTAHLRQKVEAAAPQIFGRTDGADALIDAIVGVG
jgi:CRISPR-associated protein Csy1